MAARHWVCISCQALCASALLSPRTHAVNPRHFHRAIPHSAAYVGNLIIGFIGLEHVNIPLFLCLRRTTLVFVLLSEYMVLGKHHTSATVGCVGAMVVGAMLASWDSLSSVGSHLTPTMLGFVFVGNVSTALYLALVRNQQRNTHTSQPASHTLSAFDS